MEVGGRRENTYAIICNVFPINVYSEHPSNYNVAVAH